MTARWWDRLKVARRTVIGLTVLGLFSAAGVFVAAWRASSIMNRLLREWAVETIAKQSGGVYQLGIGQVGFNWALRRVAVDSISVATLPAVNTLRPQSLPGLRLALRSCTISGVHLFRLVRGAGLSAGSFGCRRGTLGVDIPVRARTGKPAPAGLPFSERQTFLAFQQGVDLPSYAPRLHIGRITFPDMALDVGLPSRAAVTRLALERLTWTMTDLVIDPADTAAAARPLFSRKVELVAHKFISHPPTRPDRATVMRVARLQISLTDSTLEVDGVNLAPIGDPAKFNEARRYRRDLIKLAVSKVTAQGIDFGAFILGEGIRARRIEVDSALIDVTSDKRLAKGPPEPRRTPQQWIADLDETLSLDSLVVRNSELVYREHAEGRDQPGVITFARVEAAAANVNHFVGWRTSANPMTLTVRAHVQDAGQVDVRGVVPLDAPRFNMSLQGTLGAMSASRLNPFVVETNGMQIESGQVADIAFRMTVRGGVATGTITPRFTDLTVSVQREGSTGILGGGGIIGGAARGIANIAASLMVRSNNPGRPTLTPRVGMISHTFTPEETLIAFLWGSVRDGLMSVVKK